MSQQAKQYTQSNLNKENKEKKEFTFNEHETSTLTYYLNAIKKTQPLSTEEEHELGLRSMQGNIRARNKLIEANQRFAVKCVVDFHNTQVPIEEQIAAARMGLVEAATRFNPDHGVRFTSYAVHYIMEYLRQAVADYNTTIRMPLPAQKKARRELPSLNDDINYDELLESDWGIIYSGKKSGVIYMPSFHSLSDYEGMSDDCRPLIEKIPAAYDTDTLKRILNETDEELRIVLSADFSPSQVNTLMNYAYMVADGYDIKDIARKNRLPVARMKACISQLLAKVEQLNLAKVFNEPHQLIHITRNN